MNQVKIISSPVCSYCHAAKDLLKQQGISFEEIDVTSHDIAVQQGVHQLLEKSGARTVPQIYINEQPIGGFDALSELIQSRDFGLFHS